MHNIQRTAMNQFVKFVSIICCLFPVKILSAAVLEEVIVTAQKREQSLQDVGISVTAFTGEHLSKLGFRNSIELAAQTPGLTFSQEHPSLTALTIRGVSQRDFADHHEAPVATYVDGVYVSTMGAAHIQMFDLERVEVLRGPQGTLFGRNTTGGILHFVSQKPAEEFDAYGEFTYAEYDQMTFEGAIGGAITDNVLARLSVATSSHDGYMENRVGDDLSDEGTYSIRGQALFKFAEQSELLLKLYHTEDNSNGPGFAHAANTYRPDGLGYTVERDELATFFQFDGTPFQTCPGCDAHWYREPDEDIYTGSYSTEGDFDRSISGATGTLTVDFGGVILTSVTDYMEMDKSLFEDTDGSPLVTVNFYTDQEFQQFSQELRLNGEADRLTWITGLYFLDIDNETASGLAPINIAPFIGLNFPGAFIPFNTGFVADTDTESWAVFGHVEYALTEQWSITAALRYTEDDKTSHYVLSDDGFPPTFQVFNPDTAPNADLNFENVSAKLQVDWKPNENTLIYAGYNRGHKAGSFNYPFIGPIEDFATMSHDEEVLTSYEIGYKADFMDGRIRFNASGFYYDYDDYQASFFINFANIVGNVDAEVIGAELEATFSVTDRLEVLLGASLLDAESKDVGMPDGSIQDRTMANAPDYTFNGLARYTIPFANGASLALQVDFNYQDNFCFSVVCNYSEQEGSYFVSNARVSYTTADGHWSVAGFVRNLNGEEYRIYTTDSGFVGFHTRLFGPPRWFGGTVSYHWR